MLNGIEGLVRTMNRNSVGIRQCIFLLPLLLAAASAQSPSQPAGSAPVSYSSVNQLNQLLTQLEQVSQTTQIDLASTRIDHWKTDSNTKHQTQANVESLQRNLKTALPGIIGEMRNSPESLAASFKLYRNLDALYDVLSSVVESAGAFGSKDEFQSLDNDFNTIETARRSLAERMQGLAESKENELTQLRTQARNAQPVVTAPPKKVVVDDTEPVKKPAPKKKPAAKTTTPGATKPPATTTPAPKPQSAPQ
jgi:exonuclease VII large subunit